MRVVVGLGNPGGEYERTRHNIGWMALDALAESLSATRFRHEGAVDVAEATLDGEKVYLIKPQTYMNRSGQALASWLGRFKEIREALRERPEKPAPATDLPPPSREEKADDDKCEWPGLVVVTDDVNLPVGKMRFRPSGSAGGHNGLTDIQKALGGQGYPRLRLGVGQPLERMDRADYVLGRFPQAELPVVEKVRDTAAAALRDWMRHGVDAVRGKYNGMQLGGVI